MLGMRYILTLMILVITFGSAAAGNEWLAEGWPVVHHDGSNSDTSSTTRAWLSSRPAAWSIRPSSIIPS